MKNFKAAAISVAFGTILIVAGTCSAQRIVGGYSEIAKTDQTVVAAANFAVETQGAADSAALKLVSIQSAKRQIVAGSNYAMCLVVDSADRRQEATAVVYRDLQNKFALTSWTPGKCSTDAAWANQLPAVKPNASAAAVAPDQVVKNLYAAQKTRRAAPLFQAENRAAVDKYFAKDFADLIWQDATSAAASREVGVLGFDPLYNAQDSRITAFKIGAPQYGNRSMASENMATVEVSFRNFNQPETIRFILEKETGVWKISDIRYQNGDLLKGMYFAAQRDAANQTAKGEFEGNFKVGATTCTVKPIKIGFEVKCANRKAADIFFFDSNSDTSRPVFKTKNGKSRFAFDDATYAGGTFTDATGKTAKISRLQ